MRDAGCGVAWDGACLAVAMPQTQTPYLDLSFDAWEDLARSKGFEYVDSEARGRNEYGGAFPFSRLRCAVNHIADAGRAYGHRARQGGTRGERLGRRRRGRWEFPR